MEKHKQKAKRAWYEWALCAVVVVCVLAVGASLLTLLNKSPREEAEAELERLAGSYYTEYLYPRLLGGNVEHPEVTMRDYADAGVPLVYLRQLLLYNDGEHAGSKAFFENKQISCDTNSTRVHYRPVEPYGPYDYEVDLTLICEEVL